MGIEQIHEISSLNNESETQKLNKIKEALSIIKPIEKISLDSIKDSKDREDLKRKLLAIKIPYNLGILEGGIQYLVVPIVDVIMDQYDAFTNNGVENIKGFLTEKFDYIQNIFNDKLSIQENQLRYFVDTVYSTGYSFEKKGGSYFILNTKTNQKVQGLSTSLSAINKNSKLVDKLDEVLVERSFTGRGKNIQEMVLILREIGVNPENESSLNDVTPPKLAQAYLNYYSKKNKYYPIPELNDRAAVTNFLEAHKDNIPNEKITYIKLVQNNAIGKGKDDSITKDMDVFKKVMKDFSMVSKGTEEKLELLKQARTGVSDMLKEGLPGLMKYMDGPEGLLILGGLIYTLFFSDMKKEAWAGILGFTGLNVLTKAYNQDNNKGILQTASGVIKNEYKIKLPEALKGVSEKLGIQGKSKEINTISVISSVDFGDLMDNTEVKNDRIEIKDFSVFSKNQKEELKQLWPNGNYELEINKLLTKFISRCAGFTGKNNIDEIKTEMEKIFKGKKYDNPSFSLVIADVLLWNTSKASVTQQTSIPITTNTTNGTPTVKVKVSTGSNLSLEPSSVEKVNYIQLLSGYNNSAPYDINVLKILISSRKPKSEIINQLEGISGLNSTNQNIINNLVKEIKK